MIGRIDLNLPSRQERLSIIEFHEFLELIERFHLDVSKSPVPGFVSRCRILSIHHDTSMHDLDF
jgi:hypothetical protein